MRLTIITLFMVSAMGICAGQEKSRRETMISIDIFKAISATEFKIGASHALGARWSVEAEAEFIPMRKGNSRENDEASHDMILSGKESCNDESREGRHVGSISAQYWTDKAFSGPFFSIGIKTGDRITADAAAGIGYTIRIWKGTALSMKYETSLIEALGNGIKEAAEMSVSINYIF